jgi:hypothetical protein
MQDVENFDQTNEGNNEEKKKHVHTCTQHLDKTMRLAALKRD